MSEQVKLAAKKRPPKPVVYPTCDPELLAIVRTIYTRWTGQQFADAVAEIRRELNIVHDLAAKKQKIQELTENLK